MALERDPNALNILLGMQPQIPRHTDEEYQLQSMIPDEALFQAQEAIGRQGRESGGSYSVPSREALQQSGMAELRKLFGVQQAKAQAAALPSQVAGEYGLAREREHSRGGIEAARVREAAGASAQQEARAFQQAQQQRGQDFAAGQGVLNREALAGRGTQAQGATRSNLEFREQGINDRAAAKNPRSALGSLYDYFFGGKEQAAPASEAQQAVNQAKQAHPGAPLESLLQQGILSYDTPEDLAELQAAFGAR